MSFALGANDRTFDTIEGIEPFLSGGVGIGGALRAAREFRGMSLQEVADATRIRRSYLAALEEMKLDELPSRPFTIGYVRAYAQAVGISPEQCVAHFKQHVPDEAEPLRPPVGVRRQSDPRLSIAAVGAAVVVTAVLAWNITQHAVAEDGPPAPSVPEAVVARAAPPAAGFVALEPAAPAPPASDLPTPYVTPGLAKAAAEAAGEPAPVEAEAAPAVQPVRNAYMPKGAVYGVPEEQAQVVFRALKGSAIIIRGADGTVYFARQLAAGDTYRAPPINGLTVDVSDPQAFEVYANGERKGPLEARQTSLSRLAG